MRMTWHHTQYIQYMALYKPKCSAAFLSVSTKVSDDAVQGDNDGSLPRFGSDFGQI